MARTAGARNAQFEERRNALITKARSRLSMQGAEAPSFRELALAAGVSVATMRHYFGTRDGLIQAIFAQSLESGRRHLSSARAPQPAAIDFESGLKSFLQRVVIGWTEGQVGALHRIGLAEGLRSPATALAYLADILEPTLQALEQRLRVDAERGVIVECDTRHAALMLLSPILLALLHQHDLGGTRCRPLAIPALIDEHVRVFARAYRRAA
jgi:AcrR family transcriptional regulator